jgi:hypothetical protein
MACKLPHTVEELQTYIKKQTEKGDMDRQNAIVEVIKQFELAKKLKNRLRERYATCEDISAERKAVIDQFLYDEYCKDAAIADCCGVVFLKYSPKSLTRSVRVMWKMWQPVMLVHPLHLLHRELLSNNLIWITFS